MGRLEPACWVHDLSLCHYLPYGLGLCCGLTVNFLIVPHSQHPQALVFEHLSPTGAVWEGMQPLGHGA